MQRVCLVEIPGLSRGLLEHATFLTAMAEQGSLHRLTPDVPAMTIPGHAGLLTGSKPSQHGIVANGWFRRDDNEVRFWPQGEGLVNGEFVWDAGRQQDSDFTCFKYFWWPGMGSSADWFGNVRPAYCADGRKLPDIYLSEPGVATEVQEKFGSFPLFHFWGPATSVRATQWIADTAGFLIDRFAPTLSLVYFPHLDYKQQSHGPDDPMIPGEVAALDGVIRGFADQLARQDVRLIVLSSYHINSVSRPVFINRILRERGLLQVLENATGELIDYGTSEAFAVADHQIAHVYIKRAERQDEVASLLADTAGIATVLDADGKAQVGLDHDRSGELVVLAEQDSWFPYYYWLDDDKAPDFARTVAIHDKPGYDPCELHLDPQIKAPKLKIALKLVRKIIGMRYLMDVIPLDADLVRGSHGILPQRDQDFPVVISDGVIPNTTGDVDMTNVKQLLLDSVFD